MSTGIGGLTTATKLLSEEITQKKRNFSESLKKLEIAFDEFQDFFKTTNIDSENTLDAINAQLVETYKTLKLLSKVDSKYISCDADSWTAFKTGLEDMLRKQFSPVLDSLSKYVKNIKDIAPRERKLSVQEIGAKNQLFSDNRREIHEAIEDLYDTYSELHKGIKWDTNHMA